MTLSFPPNPTNGQEYTDPNAIAWQFDGVKWNIAISESLKQFSGVKIELTNAYALTETESLVSFDTEVYDTNGFFNTSTPSTITIPRTGYYRIKSNIQTGATGAGASYSIQILKNNVGLFSENMSANQNGVYDQILLLNNQDTIQITAGEASATGTLEAGTVVEVHLIGYTFGGSVIPGFEFSGIRVELFNDVSTTATPTAITWTVNDIDYDTNANTSGNTYWTDTDPTKFNILTTGYYRINSYFTTTEVGATDSYTIDIRKNGTTLESGSVGSLGTVQLDETYNFTSTDYIEVFVSNNGGVGTIKGTDTSFSLTRLGV